MQKQLITIIFRMLKGKMLKEEKGSSTLEAAIIVPAIFFTLILFICLSLIVYQKVSSYYVSAQSAARLAYTWNNSHQHVMNGFFPYHLHDDLYWRLADDPLLGVFLGKYSTTQAQVETSRWQGEAPTNLNEAKLTRMIDEFPASMSGTLAYQRTWNKKIVQVSSENPIRLPAFLERWFGNVLHSSTESRVIDAVEFIRTIDLVRYYATRLHEGGKFAQILEHQAEKKRSK